MVVGIFFHFFGGSSFFSGKKNPGFSLFSLSFSFSFSLSLYTQFGFFLTLINFTKISCEG
jgi:hypothetical protein